MELIGARFKHSVHLSAGVPSILRIIILRLDLEFADLVHVDFVSALHGTRAIVVDTVNQKLIVAFGHTGYDKTAAIAQAGSWARRKCAGRQVRKL